MAMITANDVRMLDLLGQELAVAEGAYTGRSHRCDRRALRRKTVEAKLRYRKAWRMALEKMDA